MPSLDLHYCRKSNVYKSQIFFPGTKVSGVHEDYVKIATGRGVEAASLTFLLEVSISRRSVLTPKEKVNVKNVSNQLWDIMIKKNLNSI